MTSTLPRSVNIFDDTRNPVLRYRIRKGLRIWFVPHPNTQSQPIPMSAMP